MLPLKKQNHLFSLDQQAIIALCTPRGSGAIALIRVCGDNAIQVVDEVARLSANKTLETTDSHTIHHGHVIDPASKECIDSVLFLLMKAPKTFTGQDTVEITCHNNPFIIERIIDLIIKAGARAARAGEFSKRAFLNGKIDLVQAEAINDLIHAQTEGALKQSMAMLQGSLSNIMQGIETQLLQLLGYVEASFEFLDEEQRDFDFDQAIRQRITKIIHTVKEVKTQCAHQKQTKEGIRIALIGTVNAGKSTLFNALIKKERAIVADIAGTTRDSIEAGVYHQGNFMVFIDTAGIRSTDDVIEQKGIERSFAEAAQADIVLLVLDATMSSSEELLHEYHVLIQRYEQKTIVVINKIDLVHDAFNDIEKHLLLPATMPTVHVVARNAQGIDTLQGVIDTKVQVLFEHLQSPFLLNQRQFKLLTEIESRLEFIANSYSNDIHYELMAYKLKDLLEKISELTGHNVTEQVLDVVFDEFCVGK